MATQLDPAAESAAHPAAAGRPGGAVADVDGVEIKVTLRPDQELQGLRSLRLDEDTAEIRSVHFYDTPQLDLFHAGTVLRARLPTASARP
jgi:hypothetical protein